VSFVPCHYCLCSLFMMEMAEPSGEQKPVHRSPKLFVGRGER
jgi:hypothetical protein